MTDYRHRCSTAGCPYLGELTDSVSCGCHRMEAEIMREELARSAERISEMLRFNNEFEDRARQAERSNKALVAALRAAIKVAEEAREEWDKAPAGMKAGKLPIALSDRHLRYREDIAAMHAAIDGAIS
jgi:hypothetical protein